jgi:hypothetical protein
MLLQRYFKNKGSFKRFCNRQDLFRRFVSNKVVRHEVFKATSLINSVLIEHDKSRALLARRGILQGKFDKYEFAIDLRYHSGFCERLA